MVREDTNQGGELSGPQNKAQAELKSLTKHGSTEGSSFNDLYQKEYNKATESGLSGQKAIDKAYNGIIESSKRPDIATNEKYLGKKK